MLLCTFLGSLHLNLVVAARLLGLVCTLVAFASLTTYILARFPPRQRALAACGLLPFALSAPFAVWAIGGLEQPLMIALLGWAAFFAMRWLRTDSTGSVWACGALLALLTLAPADGFGFTLLFCAVFLFRGRKGTAAAATWRLALVPCFTLLAQLGFRHKFYCDWLPNTAYVKVSFTQHRLMTGLEYLGLGLQMEFALDLLAIAGVWVLWRRNERGAAFLLTFVLIAFLAYLAFIGGDIFPALRLMMPALLLACFTAAEAARLGFDTDGRLRLPVAAALVVCAALTVCSRVGATVAMYERWEWEGKSLGVALRASFAGKHPLLSADCVGALPFFSHFKAIDPLGLSDRRIARHPTPRHGHGMNGHEMADGDYIIRRQPDIVLFNTPAGSPTPRFDSDFQIYNDTRFAPAFQLVRLHVTGDHSSGGPAEENPDMHSVFFIRREGPIGIETTANRVTVPGYLAQPEGEAFVAASVPDGIRLVLPPGASDGVQVPPGTWRVSTNNAGVAPSIVIVGSHPASAPPLTAAQIIRNDTAKTLYVRAIYLDRLTEAATSTPRSGGSER